MNKSTKFDWTGTSRESNQALQDQITKTKQQFTNVLNAANHHIDSDQALIAALFRIRTTLFAIEREITTGSKQ